MIKRQLLQQKSVGKIPSNLALEQCPSSVDNFIKVNICLLAAEPLKAAFPRFPYPDHDTYQYPCPQDFNADALFHVSVTVKPIDLFGPYF